jgi:hypothetical protein
MAHLTASMNIVDEQGLKQIMALGNLVLISEIHLSANLIRQRSPEKIEVVIAGTDSPNTPISCSCSR